MKFPVAYYLLFLYLSVIIRPLVLIGIDAYDHAFEEAIHVATVHAKYGANHLEIAVANTNKDDASKNSTSAKSEDITTAHIPAKREAILHTTTELAVIYPDVLTKKTPHIFLSI